MSDVLYPDLSGNGKGVLDIDEADALVGRYSNLHTPPSYLSLTSDIINGEPISAFRAIPWEEQAGIIARTSEYGVGELLNDLVTDMRTRSTNQGGMLSLPDGRFWLERSFIQGERVKIEGRGERASMFKMAPDAVFDRAVVVQEGDAADGYIGYGTGLSNVGIDASGFPVGLWVKGMQEGCVNTNLLIANAIDAGIRIPSLVVTAHQASFKHMQILMDPTVLTGTGIECQNMHNCDFEHITCSANGLSAGQIIGWGIKCIGDVALNRFSNIHTESCVVGIEEGVSVANNGYNSLSYYSNTAPGGAHPVHTHFLANNQNHRIDNMRTINNCTWHYRNTVNGLADVAFSADLDSIILYRAGSGTLRLTGDGIIQLGKILQASSGDLFHGGRFGVAPVGGGDPASTLVARGSLNSGATKHLVITMANAGGFAGRITIYSASGDIREFRDAVIAGYVNADGTMNGVPAITNGLHAGVDGFDTLTIGAPIAGGAPLKFKVPITQSASGLVHNMAIKYECGGDGTVPVSMEFV